jgi:multiple sugar transport system substrate-binding protein
MAIAFMANSQHLFARTDVLEQAGITEMPDDLYRGAGSRRGDPCGGDHGAPHRANMQVGWNIGEMFNTVYMAYGGELLRARHRVPAVNSEAGSRRWR